MQLSDLVTILFVLEILFAFSIGISCILFSCSLLKALNDETAEKFNERKDGMLPPSKSTEKLAIINSNNHKNSKKNHNTQKLNEMNDIIENGYDIINEYDVDEIEVDTEYEHDNETFISAIHSFLNYLK